MGKLRRRPQGAHSGRADSHISVSLRAGHAFTLQAVETCGRGTVGGAICSRQPASPRHLHAEAHLSRALGLLQRLMGKTPFLPVLTLTPELASPVTCKGLPTCSPSGDSEATSPGLSLMEDHRFGQLLRPRAPAEAAARPTSPPTASSWTPHRFPLHIPSGLRSQLYLARQRVRKCGRDQGHSGRRAAGGS